MAEPNVKTTMTMEYFVDLTNYYGLTQKEIETELAKHVQDILEEDGLHPLITSILVKEIP